MLKAFISASGDVQNLDPTSGPDLLIPAAMNAVRKWKYRPFIFQGQPTEVETQITVVFTLDRR